MATATENGHEARMATVTSLSSAGDAPDISVVLEGNQLRLITHGPTLRSALITLIDGARHSLKLYYYIFAADVSGAMVRDALARAARRGVSVTLMIDAFGSAKTPDSFFASLVDGGGQFERFGARRSTRYLIRNHQKMAIADDERLLIGGFNVEDGYFGVPQENGWRDLGLWMEGEQVEAMTRWYGGLWRWVSTKKQRFRTLRAMVRQWHPALHHDGGSAFRWLIGGPTRRLSPWAQVVKHDLEKAQRVDMIAAYFSPGRGMLKRIARAARRHGARIILPAVSDNGATVAAARLLYGPLLRRGVEIAEYQPCKLHTKLLVIDDAVFVGSANFDMRSLFLNLEVMLRVEDKAFADQVRAYIAQEMQDSRAINLRDHLSDRSIMTLVTQAISYLLVGILDYTVTRRLNFRNPDAD